jgi:tetratricopeptide (TPR) repeat protein
MFTPFIRIVLIIACLGMAILFYLREDYINSGMVVLAAGFFGYGYFKSGTVYVAFQQLKKENFDKAEKLISKIKNPNNLSKQQKSYYHFTTGIIASEKNEFEFAKSELMNALEIGLRTENDTSIVLLNLADIEYELTEFSSAKEYLNKLKNYELKPLVKSEMEKLVEKINVAQHRI